MRQAQNVAIEMRFCIPVCPYGARLPLAIGRFLVVQRAVQMVQFFYLTSNTSGGANTAIGKNAFRKQNTPAPNNTGVGTQKRPNTDGPMWAIWVQCPGFTVAGPGLSNRDQPTHLHNSLPIYHLYTAVGLGGLMAPATFSQYRP